MASMITVDRSTIGRGLSQSYVAPRVEPEAPDASDVLVAAFGYDNTIVNAIDWMSRPRFEPNPDFDVFDAIKGTEWEAHPNRFVGVRSEPELREVIGRIRREEDQRQTLARAGFGGVIASMAAGTLDPTILLPVGGWLRVGMGAGRGLRTGIRAAEGAAVVGGTVLAQEAVLHGAQETRTTVETLFAVGGAAIVGSVLGAAAGYLTRGELAALEGRLIDIPGSAAEERAAWARATSAGAAVTAEARGTGEIKDALGAERAFAWQDPLIRLQTSPFVEARNAVRDLAETPLTLAENADGIATTIGGAVETRVKMAQGPLAQALIDFDAAYSRYFFGEQKRFAALRGTLGARRAGKMTYTQFKEAVHEALLAGDVHAVKEAADAARTLRTRVFDPLKKEAIEIKLFPEDVTPLDDAGYVPRVYDTDVIAARRPAFVGVLARHFEARQRELLERIEDLEARTGGEAADPAIKDLTPDEIRALAEEVTDTILGHSPARVLTPADLVAGPRGPLKERVLRIPTSLIRDFVVRDPEVLARMYSRTMSADIGLVRKFGSTDLRDQVAKINDEANAAIHRAETEGKGAKALKALDDQRRTAIRDLTAIRDRIRGNYAIPTNPNGLLVRAGRVIRNLNYMRLLGGMTLSAVPDIGRPVMVYGLTRVMRTAFHPLVHGVSIIKLAAREAKLAGTAVDMVLDSRAMAIADIMDDYGRGSRLERAVEAGTRRFGIVSLMAPWNAAFKQFVGVVAQTRILQGVERVVGGKATTAEVEYLAANGIDAVMAGRIWKQFAGDPDAAVPGPASAVPSAVSPASPRIVFTGREMGEGAVHAPIGRLKEMVRKFAREHFADKSFENDADGSDILVPWQNIKKTTQNRTSRTALLATGQLDQLIKKGIPAGSAPDARGRAEVKAYHYYDSAVVIAGKEAEIRVVVRETRDGKRFYDHYEMKGNASPATGDQSPFGGDATQLLGEARNTQIGASGHGVKEGDVWWANTEAWTDRQAVAAMRAALVRDIDRVIVTPGQDKPLWMSAEMGKIIGQFRSFNIASVQRTILAGLQQRDAAALNGAMLMLSLGALSYYLKMEAAGYDVSDDPAKWAAEAFDRSGLMGWIADANNIAEKWTRGTIGLSALTGEQASRYASRNALGALLGPTFDVAGDAATVSGSFFAGDWTAADTHALRKLLPLQNIFYLRRLFDEVEASVNEGAGIPARSQRSSARSTIR